MGTKAKEIIINKLDLQKLLNLLNKAFADEWLAYYQYWIGAKIAEGPMRGETIAELIEHANDELQHADMVAERIIQLGGTPILEPQEWYKFTNCGYSTPTNPYVKKILEQNIKGEQCAIDVYNKILDLVKNKDSVTYDMTQKILTDEIEHEEDLQNLLKDLELIK